MTPRSDDPILSMDADTGIPEMVLRWVMKKRLQAPAAMLLEMHRPLMPLAWPAAVIFGGVFAPFFGPDYYERIEALRDPALLDRVLKRLEAGEPGGEEPGGG